MAPASCNTLIAHPFQFHDFQFNIIEKIGAPPALSEQGWKDVVLVMPMDSAKFITRFTTFSDEMTPYMYHCHLLHHEDDGMMGSFLVINPNVSVQEQEVPGMKVSVFPNPAASEWKLKFCKEQEAVTVSVRDMNGKHVFTNNYSGGNEELTIPCEHLDSGAYMLEVTSTNYHQRFLLLKEQ